MPVPVHARGTQRVRQPDLQRELRPASTTARSRIAEGGLSGQAGGLPRRPGAGPG
jgi:hypothetical protein